MHKKDCTTKIFAVSSPFVTDLHTFPVKGLPRVELQSVQVSAGGCFPHDREWALILGKYAHEWDPNDPSKMFDKEHHGTKVKFHQLISDPELTLLTLKYDAATKQLKLINKKVAEPLLDVCLEDPAGIATAETFFEEYLGDRVKKSRDGATAIKLVRAASGIDHQFGNIGGAGMLRLHLVNKKSIDDFALKIGKEIDPLRFRANIIFDEAEAWSEYEWIGKKVRFGSAVLEITEPTIRCPATWVDPNTGVVDIDVPKLLQDEYPAARSLSRSGEMVNLGGPESRGGFMGLYALVLEPGHIGVGDTIEVLS